MDQAGRIGIVGSLPPATAVTEILRLRLTASALVYRTFGPSGYGLRILNLQTNVTVTPLTKEYDNFPFWSPRGDLITFVRQVDGDYEIFTIRPDGTGLKRLTFSKGNDAHMARSPDGEWIAFASTRKGFKDEAIYTDAPQPYGELFVMRYDGTNVRQLTDNHWEARRTDLAAEAKSERAEIRWPISQRPTNTRPTGVVCT